MKEHIKKITLEFVEKIFHGLGFGIGISTSYSFYNKELNKSSNDLKIKNKFQK